MIIIFSGKQYSGKDTAAKILMEAMPDFRRCAMGDIIKIEYGKLHNISYEEIEANKPKYRQGLIDLGNWGRAQSPDYWLEKIIAQEGKIVVTDVRIKHVAGGSNTCGSHRGPQDNFARWLASAQ